MPLSPEMGSAILAHLGKLDGLPRYGVVAGQAVASAIDDLWGRGGGVYNDIDVFVPVEPGSMRSTKAAAAPSRFTPTYAENQSYGEMQRFLLQVGTYELETTARRGLVNRIYISFSGELRKNDHGKRVISSFDLNCTRVAVDLRSKRLVWDRHYEQFLKTRELRIVTAHTPVHTFLRLLNKRRQLADVKVDIETAARTCFVMQHAVLRKELRDKRAASFVFGEKYRQLAESLRSDWKDYYDWDEDWLHLDAAAPEDWEYGPGDETAVEALTLHTLRPRGELETAYTQAAQALGAMSVVILPPRIYAEREAFKASLVAGHRFEVQASIRPDSRLMAFAQARGLDYLKDLPATTDWVAFNDFLKRPVGADSYGMSGAEQMELLNTLKDAAKPLGVVDAPAVLQEAYGQVKVMHLPDLLKVGEAILHIERQPFHASPLPVSGELQVNVLRPAVQIRELHTLRELKELSVAYGFEPVPMSGRTGKDYRYLLLDDGQDRTLAVLHVMRLTTTDKLSGRWNCYNWRFFGGVVNDHHEQVMVALHERWVEQGLAEKAVVSAAIPF